MNKCRNVLFDSCSAYALTKHTQSDDAHSKRESILVSAKHGEHASYSVAVLTLFVPICPRKLCAVHTCVFYLKAVCRSAFRHACHMCKVPSHTLVIGLVIVSWRGFFDRSTDYIGFSEVFFSKAQIHKVAVLEPWRPMPGRRY